MNPIQSAIADLDVDKLKAAKPDKENLPGLLISVCSAHDPDPEKQVGMIRCLVRLGADLNETDKNGVTPLHRAVRFRSPAAVRELIKLGANIDAQDRKSKSTPLHRAVTSTGAPTTKGKGGEAREIAALLLNAGANPNVKNKLGKRPVDYVKTEDMKAAFKVKSRT